MVAQKCKTVSTVVADGVLKQTKKAASAKQQDQSKRKRVSKAPELVGEATAAEEPPVPSTEDAADDNAKATQEEPVESPEEALLRKEEETTIARRKELKGMYMEELKAVVADKGLELGKKEVMIEAVLAQEAKSRAESRAQAARMRAAVVQKKAELEALPLQQLKELCIANGIAGNIPKTVRVEQLLKQWQDEDGVDKALAKIATDARQGEFESMDARTLTRYCDHAGVNPFVKEVMVDRLLRTERAAGRFARPAVAAPLQENEATSHQGGDVVEALIANEANRKREREQKKLREEATENRRKELKAMPNEELRKLIATKGQEPAGKKDEMIEVLMSIRAKEEAAAARRSQLKALAADDLKRLALSSGVDSSAVATAGKKKETLIDAVLEHEAKLQQATLDFELKSEGVLAILRKELDEKTASELKELCAQKGLKLGLAKEDRMARLLEDAKANGEVDSRLAVQLQAQRRQELLSMDASVLLQLCKESGTNPLVKEVAVERLLAYECDSNSRIELPAEAPAAKRQKVSKE